MDHRAPILDALSSKRSEYRSDVDGLRSLAVLSVLSYHVGAPAVTGGFLGVDVFFVISGYLITRKIRHEVEVGDFTFFGFWTGRYRRLFPALAVTLLASLLAGYFIFPPEYLAQFGASAAFAVPGLSNLYFWTVSGYFDTQAITKPALHTWSLSVEEQFYYLWPLLLVPLVRQWSGKIAMFAIFVIGALSLLASIFFLLFGSTVSNDPASAVFYLLPFRVYELALGALVVWVRLPRGASLLVRELLTLTGFAAVTISMFIFSERSWLPALLPCAGTALLIFAGQGALSARLYDNPPSVLLGKISYSIYLVHWPIIVFSSYLIDTSSAEAKLALCAASIASAILLYYGVERPIHVRRLVLRTTGQFYSAMLPVAAVLIAVCTSAATSNGWLWRYEPPIAGLLDPVNASLGLPAVPYRCFLTPTDTWNALDPRCYTLIANQKPNVILVGDSTAAVLYPGLKAVLAESANLYLWAGSACVPALDVPRPDRPNCPGSNDRFFRHTIADTRYDLVILSGHGGYPELQQGFPAIKTILNEKGVPFILLGDVPTYAEIPRAVVAKHGKIDGLDDVMAASLAHKCLEENGLDRLVDASEFFSTRAIFCKDDRPIYRDGVHLFQRDWFHLTQAGALYLAKALAPRIQAVLR